jgi:predicted ATPase
MTRLRHYEMGDCLDRGGMGEVFRARDTRLMRPVAIKFLKADAMKADPSVARRFLREARAASALNHPNIVTIHEIGETEGGDPYIVLELIEGRTLRSLVEASPDPLAVAEVGCQVARALAAAHEAGITHRDIKPENVMVRDDGLVKVLDFGLARLGRNREDALDPQKFETEVGLTLGTPAYMSPEHAAEDDVGPASDIFSLGVVLYELLSGRRPFTGSTPMVLLAQLLTAEPPPLGSLRTDAPGDFVDLVHRMLVKEPEHRPAAVEVERVLESIVTGTATTPPPSGLPTVRPDAAVVVGRDAERAHLLRAFRHARDVGGRMVAVAGEPGIGKSTVIDGFLADLGARGEAPLVLRGHCSESLAGAEAYLPVLEALDQLRSGAEAEGLHALFRRVAPTWYDQITSGAERDTDAPLSEAAPAASPERMKRELGSLLEELSHRGPVILVVEDLHWADVSTVDMLTYLAGRFSSMRVMVLTGYRPSDMALSRHPFLGVRNDLRARGLLDEIELGFLGPADVSAYLDLRFPGHRFPEGLAGRIHARTDGSPLFMADLVRYLRDTGRFFEGPEGWELAGDTTVAPESLPDTVRSMIDRKIEQVDPEDRALLDAACVLGREFDSSTVGAAIGMEPIEVEDRLDRLERVHVLVRLLEESELPDGTLTLRYRFVHVLYQNTLFAALRPSRRVALSSALARTMAAHHGAELGAVAARLALLHEGAREFQPSATYYFLAAQRAIGLFGYREALSLAERGLSGLRSVPEGPARLQLELGLQMTRGHAQRCVKGWAAPELERTFARARELCQALNDPPELFPVLWNLNFFHMIRGDLARSREQAAELMAQAEAVGESAYLMSVHHVAGVTCEFLGDLVESNRLLERARELHDPARHLEYTQMFGIDPGMIARAMSARPLWSLGHPDRALERSRETIELGRSQRQPVSLVFALLVAEGVHLFRGEAEAAIALGDEVISLCHEYEFPQEAEWAKGFQGGALALLGRADEGVARLQEALAALAALDSGLVRTMFLSILADAAIRAGAVDVGLGAVREGFEHAERTLEGGFVGELHRAHGELTLLCGDRDGAERSLREALAYTRAQNARSFELRAATGLARLLVESGRAREARSELEPVFLGFEEGHDTADLVAAASLLPSLH